MPPYTQARPGITGFEFGQPPGYQSYPSDPMSRALTQPRNPYQGMTSPTQGSQPSFGANPFLYSNASRGYSPVAPQRGRQAPRMGQMGQSYRQGGYGGAEAPQGQPGGMAGPGFASPLPPGGIYGQAKWDGGLATDVFMRRGTPIYAPFDGYVTPGATTPPGPMGQVPGLTLRGQGIAMQAVHAQIMAQGMVRKGQQIGVVNDPTLDMLGPYQGMPDGFQHADLRFSRSGQFSTSGGDMDARQFLQMVGYQGRQVPGATRGPQGGGMPGMGMGGGMPGMGMPGMMGFGGGGGGMPGMGGNPFMMGGMPGMGGGQNPFMMGGGGGFGGGMFGRMR